jgi:hypothetical protein
MLYKMLFIVMTLSGQSLQTTLSYPTLEQCEASRQYFIKNAADHQLKVIYSKCSKRGLANP